MELEIQSRNVAMTPRWKTEIDARMDDLRRGHDDLIHGRVTLIKNRHHKKLEDGTEVVFGLEQGDKGPQATVVTLLPPIAKVL
jgi:cold shock CspA family protein